MTASFAAVLVASLLAAVLPPSTGPALTTPLPPGAVAPRIVVTDSGTDGSRPAAAAARPSLAAPGGSSGVARPRLRWTSVLLPSTAPADSIPGAGAAALDVVGGGPGIVAFGGVAEGGIGSVGTRTLPATWISSDGGATWGRSLHAVPPAARPPAWDRFWASTARAGLFVAATSTAIWHSTDGVEWTQATAGPTFLLDSRPQLEAGLGGFVALFARSGSTTTEAWTSVDGDTWHRAPDQVSLRHVCPTSLAVSPSRAVAVAARCPSGTVGRPPVILVSTDGRTWRRAPAQATIAHASDRRPSVSFVGGRFLLTGSVGYSTAVWSSSDGIRWVRTALVRSGAGGWDPDTIVGVVRLGAAWIAAGYRTMPADDCRPVAWVSADLVRWSRVLLPMVAPGETCYVVEEVIATAGRVVAVGHAWDMAGGSRALVWIGVL